MVWSEEEVIAMTAKTQKKTLSKAMVAKVLTRRVQYFYLRKWNLSLPPSNIPDFPQLSFATAH